MYSVREIVENMVLQGLTFSEQDIADRRQGRTAPPSLPNVYSDVQRASQVRRERHRAATRQCEERHHRDNPGLYVSRKEIADAQKQLHARRKAGEDIPIPTQEQAADANSPEMRRYMATVDAVCSAAA